MGVQDTTCRVHRILGAAVHMKQVGVRGVRILEGFWGTEYKGSLWAQNTMGLWRHRIQEGLGDTRY